jgi:hypothetical protein
MALIQYRTQSDADDAVRKFDRFDFHDRKLAVAAQLPPRGTPRARKCEDGSQREIPAGFTYGDHLVAHDKLKTGWRCGYVTVDSTDGEPRRCTAVMSKRRCERHFLSHRHAFGISRDDDLEFPEHYEGEEIVQAHHEIVHHIAEFAVQANLSVEQVSGPAMTKFLRGTAAVAMHLSEAYPDASPEEIIGRVVAKPAAQPIPEEVQRNGH